MKECLICASTSDLTVEHIIPQALWRRFEVDPHTKAGDVWKTRTDLCGRCNSETASLHNRENMMTMLETGSPVSVQTLSHIADWAYCVLLLLGLANGTRPGGGAVIPADVARSLLRARFVDHTVSSVPKGVRVYAGLATTLEPAKQAETASFAVALRNDPDLLISPTGAPIGYSTSVGQTIQAATAIGIGKFAILVLGSTHRSDADHEEKLDEAAATVGLVRVHPLPPTLPTFIARAYDWEAVRTVFVRPSYGGDLALLPEGLKFS